MLTGEVLVIVPVSDDALSNAGMRVIGTRRLCGRVRACTQSSPLGRGARPHHPAYL
jgi:hypothetical protein